VPITGQLVGCRRAPASLMIALFKKEIPSNPLYLSNGKRLRFITTESGVGILAVNSHEVGIELRKMAARRAGGLTEISSAEYEALKSGMAGAQARQVGIDNRNGEQPGIDQIYIKWRIAKGRFAFKPISVPHLPLGRMIHCLERHRQVDAQSERRVMAAWESWLALYRTGLMVPCHLWDYPRSARVIGDTRDLPYLKDVLAAGIAKAAPGDLIVLTNDDTIMHAQLLTALMRLMATKDAVSSFRLNFPKDFVPPPTEKIERIVKRGANCLGRDLFCFRREWLVANLDAFPDFILGEQEWDLVLAVMVRQTAKVMTTKINFEQVMPACELAHGYLIHEMHERLWTDPRYQNSPAKLHNNRLMCEWHSDNGFENLIGKLL